MKIKLLIVLLLLSISNYSNAQVSFNWAKSMGGASSDAGNSIAVDASGNVYTTGNFVDTVDFDPGAAAYNLYGNVSGTFISKLDASGNLVWATAIPGSSLPKDIALDASNNSYITGYFSGTMDFNPGAGSSSLTSAGGTDVFVCKFDAAGAFVWVKQFAGTGNDAGNTIAVDAIGDVYTAGYFENTVDFDPGVALYNLSSIGFSDVFISKLTSAGNFVWTKSFGSIASDGCRGITLDASGNIFTTGNFVDTVDFDPGAGVTNLVSTAFADIFISKLDAAGNFVWAKSIGGSSNDYGRSITIGPGGDIYSIGTFINTVDFDPGVGVSNLIASSATGSDIYVLKLDATGTFVWAKGFGSPSSGDLGLSISVDAFGNSYSCGSFSSTGDFDPNGSVFNLTTLGGFDAYIVKLDVSGNLVWAHNIGGLYQEIANSTVVDPVGNIYVTGSFGGTTDFDPTGSTFNITGNGSDDIFILKLHNSNVGIEDERLKKEYGEITVFPNPSSNQITLEFELIGQKSVSIEIRNILGQLVYSKQNQFSLGKQIVEVDVADFSNGVYFVQLQEGNRLSQGKFVKQ